MFTVRKTDERLVSSKHRLVPDSVATAGSVIGLLSLLLGWLTLKPSRVAAGVSLRLWEVEWVFGVALLGLWLACLAFSLIELKRRSILLGILANVIIVLTLVFAGLEASRLLVAESPRPAWRPAPVSG